MERTKGAVSSDMSTTLTMCRSPSHPSAIASSVTTTRSRSGSGTRGCAPFFPSETGDGRRTGRIGCRSPPSHRPRIPGRHGRRGPSRWTSHSLPSGVSRISSPDSTSPATTSARLRPDESDRSRRRSARSDRCTHPASPRCRQSRRLRRRFDAPRAHRCRRTQPVRGRVIEVVDRHPHRCRAIAPEQLVVDHQQPVGHLHLVGVRPRGGPLSNDSWEVGSEMSRIDVPCPLGPKWAT